MTEQPANALSYRLRVISRVKKYYEGVSLLDVGCGDGIDDFLLLDYFKTIEGVDIEENKNWASIRNERLNFRALDAGRLPYPDNSFDTVIEKDMLHHAADPAAALNEMCRVAKKKVIVLEANRYNPIFYLHLTLMEGHQHFTQKKFLQLLDALPHPHETANFSARVCPVNNKFLLSAVNLMCDLAEKIPFYRPVIEYNVGIISKK